MLTPLAQHHFYSVYLSFFVLHQLPMTQPYQTNRQEDFKVTKMSHKCQHAIQVTVRNQTVLLFLVLLLYPLPLFSTLWFVTNWQHFHPDPLLMLLKETALTPYLHRLHSVSSSSDSGAPSVSTYVAFRYSSVCRSHAFCNFSEPNTQWLGLCAQEKHKRIGSKHKNPTGHKHMHKVWVQVSR